MPLKIIKFITFNSFWFLIYDRCCDVLKKSIINPQNIKWVEKDSERKLKKKRSFYLEYVHLRYASLECQWGLLLQNEILVVHPSMCRGPLWPDSVTMLDKNSLIFILPLCLQSFFHLDPCRYSALCKWVERAHYHFRKATQSLYRAKLVVL